MALPLPLPLVGGCSPKSNIPVAWNEAGAAAATAAVGTGPVMLAVRFSCRRRSTKRERKLRSINHGGWDLSAAMVLAEEARPSGDSAVCAAARIKVRDRGERATPGESGGGN